MRKPLCVILVILLIAAVTITVSAENYAAGKPGKVTSLTVKAVSPYSVRLTWKKVKGADGYQIYKVTRKKTKKIATVKGASRKSYIVKKLKTNAIHSFKVRAYKKSSHGSCSRKVSLKLTPNAPGNRYGVFLSETKKINRLGDYKTVVIDAQYYSKEQIDAFKRKGHKVYSYINVGSLEDFRPYYREYKDLIKGRYENWDEEYWIDVSNQRWQDFMINELIPSLLSKNIDGFFVDNCDVYYHYPEEPIMNGLTSIMHTMVSTGKAVLINGGDTYLDAYCKGGGSWDNVITGINQETVFSSILDYDKDKFGTAGKEDREYYQAYIRKYAKKGADIYLLEYTEDPKLIRDIRKYCKKKGFGYYISDSVELDY